MRTWALLCSAPRRPRNPKDDRPFPECDRAVFPRENLYDRILLRQSSHSLHWHNGEQSSFKTVNKDKSSFKTCSYQDQQIS